MRILFAFLRETGFQLKSFCKRNIRCGRHQLGDTVGLSIGNAQGTAHITDNRLGHHFSKSADLGNFVITVFFRNVLDDFPPALLAEIDIDIRHADAVGIQKTLKQQAVAQRVNIGDSNRVGDQ